MHGEVTEVTTADPEPGEDRVGRRRSRRVQADPVHGPVRQRAVHARRHAVLRAVRPGGGPRRRLPNIDRSGGATPSAPSIRRRGASPSTSSSTAMSGSPAGGPTVLPPGTSCSSTGPTGGYAPSTDGGLAPDGRRRERPAGDRGVARGAPLRRPGGRRRSSSTTPTTRSTSTHPATSTSRWVHRTSDPGNHGLLLAAVEDASNSTRAPPDLFVHGEASEVRAVRRHLLVDRGIARNGSSISPYWRRNFTDEAWRKVKAEFVAEMQGDGFG